MFIKKKKTCKWNALDSTDKCVKCELPNKIPILVWVRRFSKVDKIIQIYMTTFRLLQVLASPLKVVKSGKPMYYQVWSIQAVLKRPYIEGE